MVFCDIFCEDTRDLNNITLVFHFRQMPLKKQTQGGRFGVLTITSKFAGVIMHRNTNCKGRLEESNWKLGLHFSPSNEISIAITKEGEPS